MQNMHKYDLKPRITVGEEDHRPDNGVERTVTLVYPAEADIAQNRISVLTPVGTALIGLARGQSITWTARNGTRHVLSVIAVTDPVDA